MHKRLAGYGIAIGALCLAATPGFAKSSHQKFFNNLENTKVHRIGGAHSDVAPSEYTQRDFSSLKGMPGFSDKALDTHFKLYGGYVKNTNLLLSTLRQLSDSGETKTPHYAELKRRFGWEFDGMRLHELYFENMGGSGQIDTGSELHQWIVRDFGSYEAWEKDFRATGGLRGIGWVVLYEDIATHRLMNVWIGEHDAGHLSGAQPLLVMDVWEHAYMVDYNIDRGSYIDAFVKNIDWNTVAGRAHP